LWGIETVILRVFNAYGPGQHLPPSHAPVIPHYLLQASRGGTIVMHGDGTQTRDYVYVDDVVSAMISAATAPGINHQIINIGSGKETSIRDLVRLIMEVTGMKLEAIANAKNDPGVSRMQADINLAREKLGYHPRFSLEEGLRLTLKRDPRFNKEVLVRP
jgi:UDP-glucose 4-epimerase